MKKWISASLAGAIALGGLVATATPATARDGCGYGGWRDGWGRCHTQYRRDVVAVPGSWVVGRYYEGRGYWGGNGWRQDHPRYWRHDNGWHRGWDNHDRGHDHDGDRDHWRR